MKSFFWKTLPLFIIIFFITTILLSLVALAHYWQVTLKERTTFESNEASIIQQGKTAIEQQLSGVVSDINFLVNHGEHYRTSYGKAYSLFDNATEQNEQLTRLLYTFSEEKKRYDQIRFLDTQGAEIIRLNNNQGTPFAITSIELQKKSTRYYYQEINRLKRGELYISPLDLNIEKGKIERPFKPVLRFAKAVFNAQGVHKGSLLLNFMGEEFLSAFREATQTHQSHIMLLNNNGYWLSSPNKNQEWGFMFDKEENFGRQYNEAWTKIKNSQDGQFYNSNKLITYTTVNPLLPSSRTSSTPSWKIVSLVPESNTSLDGAFDKYVTLYSSILLLLGFGAWLLASTIIRHRQSELQVVFEQRFRQVLEHVDLLAVAFDINGNITFCNDSLTQLTGWERNEIIGRNWFDTCIPKDSVSKTIQLMQDIRTGKKVDVREDAVIQTKIGNICKVEWNHTLMKDAKGEVIGITCIGENVTEVRAQEKQLFTLSRAIEQSPAVVLIVGTDGRIEYTNPRFTEVTGYTKEEALGENPNILRSEPHTNKKSYRKLWKRIHAGGTWHGIFKNKKKNGDIYWASASISGLRDKAGNIVNYIGVQEDITQRTELESELEQRNLEVAKSKTLAVVGRMASMVAHDLRNPLSSIKMSLQILSKPTKTGTEKYNQELKNISLEQVGYMEIILEDLLNYARPPALNLAWLDIKDVLNETINMLQGLIQESEATIHTNIQQGLPTIYADSGKLRLILSNTISNAIQAAAESGKKPEVKLSAMSQLGNHTPSIQIEICDNGPGIENDKEEQLFEPFYTSRAKGTGLGLAIVKGFIEQHQGHITLHSIPKRVGTTCTISLPISVLMNQPTKKKKVSDTEDKVDVNKENIGKK